jgi:predicted dehydrogenase
MPDEEHGPEGPPFHDCGMHYIDLARWYANSEIERWDAISVIASRVSQEMLDLSRERGAPVVGTLEEMARIRLHKEALRRAHQDFVTNTARRKLDR